VAAGLTHTLAAGLRRAIAWLGAAALCGCAATASAQTASPPAPPPTRSVQLDLEPVFAAGALHLRVDLRFTGSPSGSTPLELPNAWASETQLYQAVQNLHAVDAGVTLADGDQPFRKLVKHAPSQPVHLQYELVQDFAGPVNAERRFRAVLQPQYFHLIGYAFWVLPATDGDDLFDVQLRWNRLPAGWTLANSFGTQQQTQHFTARSSELGSAIFVGGDFRINRREVDGQPVFTAVRGDWSFSDAQFTDTVARIVALERGFWHSVDPYFLVTLVPLTEPRGHRSSGGTGLTASFDVHATPNIAADQFERLITHEYFHNWNPRRLGRFPQPQASMYWVSEGFTDYYALVLRLRGGLLTLEAFVEQVNALLRRTYVSPVREAGNDRVVKDFWNSGAVKDLPYQRGALLALQWNAQIRQVSGGAQSFDDVMRSLLAVAKGPDGRLALLTPQHVLGVVSRHTGTDETSTWQQHIMEGRLIAPAASWLGPHVTLEQRTMPVFELGLDPTATNKDHVVHGVLPDGAAWRAGLRDGQALAASSWTDDPLVPAVFKIREEGGTGREIRFLPQTAQPVTVPQFVLPAAMTPQQRANTLRWLGAVPKE
jgi:predicted metalloprotease with PDZ domain